MVSRLTFKIAKNMRKIHLFVLIAMLLVGITFSVIQIIKANPDAPNPGHSASEIECDTNLCIATTTGRVGIGSTSPGAKLQINPSNSTEGLRIVTASDYSPLNIRNATNDIFRVDQTGTLAAGAVPWARLSSFPSACTSGQYVTAVGGTLPCAAVSGLPSGTSGQTLRYGSSGWEASSVLLNNGTGVTIGGSGKLTVTTIDPVYNNK